MDRVYIMADLEGIAGMASWDRPEMPPNDRFSPEEFFEFRRRRYLQLTEEVNAAVEGASAAGGEEIVVWDSHGRGFNILPEKLHPECTLITGEYRRGRSFYPLLDQGWDAALYIGGHARAGTLGATLPHTLMILNGRPMGEVGMFAAVCGHLGIPMVYVSGDQAVVDEVRELIPQVGFTVTKWALHATLVRTLPCRKAVELIRRDVEAALRRRDEIPPLRLERPYEVVYDAGGRGERMTGEDLFELYAVEVLNRLGYDYGPKSPLDRDKPLQDPRYIEHLKRTAGSVYMERGR